MLPVEMKTNSFPIIVSKFKAKIVKGTFETLNSELYVFFKWKITIVGNQTQIFSVFESLDPWTLLFNSHGDGFCSAGHYG